MQKLIVEGLLVIVAVMAVALLFMGRRKKNMTKKQQVMLGRILVAAVLLLVLQLLPENLFSPLDGLLPGLAYWVQLALYLVDYLIIGYDILLKAGKGIKNGQVFDECFLMAIATVGALALALYDRSGDYTEAIAVMLFTRSASGSRATPWAGAAGTSASSWISGRTTLIFSEMASWSR